MSKSQPTKLADNQRSPINLPGDQVSVYVGDQTFEPLKRQSRPVKRHIWSALDSVKRFFCQFCPQVLRRAGRACLLDDFPVDTAPPPDLSCRRGVAREEIFGPVISALPFSTLDEVVARANATDYGLGSGVWTTGLSTAHRMARAIRSGVVWINCYQAGDAAVPFGGYKSSGYGRESGTEHLEEFLETKSVWINLG